VRVAFAVSQVTNNLETHFNYGWLCLAAALFVLVAVILIRVLFRHGKSVNEQ